MSGDRLNNLNGIDLPAGSMELIIKELHNRKRYYLSHTRDASKTDGTRLSNLKRVDQLDELVALLCYATGIKNPTPNRLRH